MRKWRSGVHLLFVLLAGGVSAAGCADHGHYHVAWTFVGDEPAASGCGLHGVDAIHVTGASKQGDGEDVVTLCAPGGFTHEVPVGDWNFTFHQLDVRGRPIVLTDDQGGAVPDPTATAVVSKDTTSDVDPPVVVLTPRPECNDGIDNDGDGRIDLDDAECMNDPNTAEE